MNAFLVFVLKLYLKSGIIDINFLIHESGVSLWLLKYSLIESCTFFTYKSFKTFFKFVLKYFHFCVFKCYDIENYFFVVDV